MGFGCLREHRILQLLEYRKGRYRIKPRLLVQASENRTKLGNLRGRAGAGLVSCEVGRLGKGSQRRVWSREERSGLRSESLTQMDTNGMGTEEMRFPWD